MKIISLLVGLIRSNSPERAHPRTALTAMRLGRGVYAASSSFTCGIGVFVNGIRALKRARCGGPRSGGSVKMRTAGPAARRNN